MFKEIKNWMQGNKVSRRINKKAEESLGKSKDRALSTFDSILLMEDKKEAIIKMLVLIYEFPEIEEMEEFSSWFAANLELIEKMQPELSKFKIEIR